MLHRLRHQAMLLDRFWESVRTDPRRTTLPPTGLNPEIADLAARLSTESRSLAPSHAFRAALRAEIEATANSRSNPATRPAALKSSRVLPEAAFMPDDEGVFPYGLFSRRHRGAEWARFAAAILAFVAVGALLVALLRDSDEDGTLGMAATATPTTDPALGMSIPPEVPVQIALNSGRPSWGIAVGAESIWVGTTSEDGSTIVRAARTGRLGGEVQATIPLPGMVWDVAYGHGSVWATVIGDSLTGEGSALVRIDPATNAITATISLGVQPTDILIDGDAVWVTDLGEPSVWRVDPATNVVAATIELGEPADSTGVVLAKTGDALWALASHDISGVELLWIDPASNAVVASTMLPEVEPTFGLMAGTQGSLWIATESNTLLRLNVWTGVIEERIDLPGFPRAILADDEYVWVLTMAWSPMTSERGDGWLNALVLIDAPSGRVHSINDLHENVPWALAVGDPVDATRVWISMNSEADQQARLRGESRPSLISVNPYPPTPTVVGVVATSDASPAASASPTPIQPISTPEPTMTATVEAAP